MDTRTDSDLMASYAEARDENAFAELVARHQRMIYRVCLRMLRHHQEAEDTTQAVFLVLLNKASRLTRKGELTGWLYGVARNVCLEALRKRARRQEEAMMDETEVPAVVESSPNHEEVMSFLDEELAGLSGALRQAVVLRYLQNHSETEAAQRASCAVGTLSSRASRGIERLRLRLAKRGVALSGVALVSLLTSEASAAVPETLLSSILATVKTVATGAATTAATTTAAMLAKGAMKAMFIAKVKMVAAVAAVAAGLSVPIGLTVAGLTNKSEKETEMTNAVTQDVVTGVAVPMGIAVAQAANEVKPARTVQTAGPAQDTKQELDKLQGEWTMDSLEESGKKVPDEFVKTFKLMIQGGKWMVQCGDGKPGKATFKIDPSKNPKTIDLTFEFEDKEEVSPGIYKVDGDTLTLCRSTSGKAERPTEFKIRDVQDVLVVWKRAKK